MYTTVLDTDDLINIVIRNLTQQVRPTSPIKRHKSHPHSQSFVSSDSIQHNIITSKHDTTSSEQQVDDDIITEGYWDAGKH